MCGLRFRLIALSILIVSLFTGCAGEQTDISISSASVSIDNLYAVSKNDSNEVETNIEETQSQEIEEEEISQADYVDIKDAKVGDYIIFGTYEQDNNKSNKAEDIEWLVLDEDEDKILVLSRYIIEKKAFNENSKTVGWAQCTLRSWLNEDFLKSAFSDEQIEQIILTQIDNPGSSGFYSDFKRKSGTAAAKKTSDQVFLLSYKEVIDYFEPQKVDKFYVYVDKDMICTATAATGLVNEAMSQLDYDTFYKEEGWPQDCVGVDGCGWFLRSIGLNSADVMSVGYDGAMRAHYTE